MPAPITHIALALLALPSLPDKDPKAFIVGASLPDIRYLGVATRDETHLKNPSWEHIKKTRSSCMAGFEFHALVDEAHNAYLEQHHVYWRLPKVWNRSTWSSQHLKFFEDLRFYPRIPDSTWQTVVDSFETIYPDELTIIPDKHALSVWHTRLQDYLSQKPTPATIRAFVNMKIPAWYGFFLSIPMAIYAYYRSMQFSMGLSKALDNQLLCSQVDGFYTSFKQFLNIP